jgi:hypothetical protein
MHPLGLAIGEDAFAAWGGNGPKITGRITLLANLDGAPPTGS